MKVVVDSAASRGLWMAGEESLVMLINGRVWLVTIIEHKMCM